MPVVTQILQQKRAPNRRSVHLDGQFAFGCNVNVVAKFRLREGLVVTNEQIEQILRGEVKQECFDRAMRALQNRLHSRAELYRKLMRREYGEQTVNAVLDDLARLGYINDEQFAKTKALLAAQHKHHGRRRAMMELLKAGVNGEVAERALGDVYNASDSLAVARQLAEKKAKSLARLDPMVARRRLAGMLQRRGFDYETIKPVIDDVLKRPRGFGDF
jgi:regulatory protein